MNAKVKALFAHAVNMAVEEDYIEVWDICEALNRPHPCSDESLTPEQEREEYEKLWNAFDEAFKQFFGYSRDNIPNVSDVHVLDMDQLFSDFKAHVDSLTGEELAISAQEAERMTAACRDEEW